MRAGMSYADLVETAVNTDRFKEDYIVPGRQVEMISDDIMRYGTESGRLSKVAHNNVCQKLRIPTRFYERMTEREGLRSHVVTELIQNSAKPFLFRTLAGDIRAMLSDKYKTIDNLEILTAASPVLKDMNIEFKSANITNERMYLQIAFPGLSGEVKAGDVVQYGLTITNSEVGLGTVRVSPTIWRLVCSNGLITTSETNYRHIGKKNTAGEDYSVYSDETLIADRKAFQMKLQDTIVASVSEARFDTLLEKMKGSTEEKIEDVVKTVENITKRYSFTEDESVLLTNNIFSGSDNSRWGVVNAVTAMAHSTDDPNKAYEYEMNGAEILDLPRNQWEVMSA